ncbi:hypothetical protein BDD43_0887 [Mucilaginibacter gracilis]|uniref:Uncharacterized protein n=1 Tax=Mucilaginibacter gracilis TaxID=423350 RepID=A0A495IW66_9SPHI|nr:hypothetical protein [Mucilaginibacter gracilis]RKR80753.1 hypothetical protein BDD43_0887 [Mucilaginibacter gracilis]
MELLFNELSINPLSANLDEARQKMLHLIDAMKMAKQKGFRKIRCEYKLNEIQLTADVSIQDWLLAPENRTYMDFVYGVFIFPFLDLENEAAFIRYDEAHYSFESEEHDISRECLGLAAAYIYGLPAISLAGFPLWESYNLTISINFDGTIQQKQVLNIAKHERLLDQDFIDFFENYGDLVLPTTNIAAKDKNYHLAAHHGVAELTALCKQLIDSPYVIEMRSMEWCKGKCNNFIKNCSAAGVVEIVLIKSTRKYGLWVQTTGTNYRQTKAIAEILEERYS